MSVRVTGVDPADRRGGWDPDVDRRLATLSGPVRTVLEPFVSSLTAADGLTIVPDAHYPFHPSSGTVTDPAVVGAFLDTLANWTDADVAVVGATDDRIAFDRTAAYLGYPDVVDRFDADLVDLADHPRRDAVVSVEGRRVVAAVPERLLETVVVVVPTLCPTATGAVAGGMRTLGRLVAADADDGVTAVAATRAVEPALAVLDATMAYGGEPVAADALAAGPTPRVDALAASLLERSIEEDPALRAAFPGGEPSITLDRSPADADDAIDLTALRRRLPDGELPPTDGIHPAVSTAYRLYAAVAGDAVPPQFESRR